MLAAVLSGAVSVVVGWWVRGQAQQSNLTTRYGAALIAMTTGNVTARVLAQRELKAIAATRGRASSARTPVHW